MLQSGNVPSTFGGNIDGSATSGATETLNESDSHHHHHHPTTDDTDNTNANISVVGGSSDGTSTPSENTPVIIDNRTCLSGDVSTSETDSDSNVSTENEDNNNDEDEEDEGNFSTRENKHLL